MTSVLIASDRMFRDTVEQNLCRFYSAAVIRGNVLHTPRRDAALLLCDAGSVRRNGNADTIVLFRNPPSGRRALLAGMKEIRGIAVVDSCDEAMIRCVSDLGMPAITCGLSSRDTITLSSMDTDSAVINLQRTITGFNGSSAEPQEVPVRVSGAVDHYALMATACVFILRGDTARLSGSTLKGPVSNGMRKNPNRYYQTYKTDTGSY